MNSFYNEDELKKIGLKKIGNNVLISRKCSIYDPKNISLGNNVRIDDFCIISGNITIGNYVHISAYTAIYGKYGVKIGNFCGLSPRCTIFSGSDDFSGEYMISPMVPEELTNIQKGKVILEDYVQLGTNSTALPNIICYEGSVSGAYSFILQNLDPWTINIGIPCKKIKDRSKNILNLKNNIVDATKKHNLCLKPHSKG